MGKLIDDLLPPGITVDTNQSPKVIMRNGRTQLGSTISGSLEGLGSGSDDYLAPNVPGGNNGSKQR